MTEKKDDDEDAAECLPKHQVQRLTCEATVSDRQAEVMHASSSRRPARFFFSWKKAVGRATDVNRDGEFTSDQHFAKGRGSELATVWLFEDFTD